MSYLINAAITRFRVLRSDEEGATMVEYGLLIALIAVVAITAIETLGGGISDMFSSVNDTLESVDTGAGGEG